MTENNQPKKCKFCGKLIAEWNKSGVCSNCQRSFSWRDDYNKLKKEFERYKELSNKIILDYYNKLKKYEPDLVWDGEPK